MGPSELLASSAIASTNSNKTMLVQITNDQSGPKLVCPICSKALVSLNGYVKHMKKHDPPGGFLCKYCDDRFCTDELLKKHRQETHSTLACRLCHETFPAAEDYREHIRIRHNGIDREMSVCTKCGVEFKTKEALKRHESTQCGQIKPHKCDQCDIAFYTIYNLKEHKKIHSGEKKFCCSYCGKNFLQKGRLVVHERSHTGEKPYKCDVCAKCFAHRESFVTHASIHTGVKLVICKCCDARFSCYSNLIKHRRSRPDTCGLTIYDPSKDAVRTGKSRIPASLMTSEIRISNASKIIKPSETQKIPAHVAKIESISKVDLSGLPSSDVDNMDHTRKHEDTKSGQLSEKIDSNSSKIVSPQITSNKEDKSSDDTDDSEDDYPDFDPPDNINDDNDSDDVKLPEPKLEIVIKEENPAEFDTLDTNFLPNDLNVKSENNENNADLNAFVDKDQILDALLMENSPDSAKLLNFHSIKLEELCRENVGEEIKVDDDALATSEHSDGLQECTLVIEDVCNRYPQLKTDKTIKLSQNTKSLAPVNKKQKPQKKEHVSPKLPSQPRMSSTPLIRRIYQSELKQRMKLMKKDKTYECIDCIKVYHIRKPYETHLREYHKKTDLELREIFKDEEDELLDNIVFKCPICSKIYLIEKRLQSHIILHGPNGILVHKCPCYCTKFFATKEEAFEHAKAEHKELIYCKLCDKFKNTPDGFKTHMLKHAPDKKPRVIKRNLVCDKCAKKFASRTSLIDHTRSDCGRNPIYQCEICEKRFTSAGILKTHKLLHKDETPYQCDQCGKTFKVKAQYMAHMKTRHTDYKPFKCHLCPKEYPYRESLLTHMTVHTGFKRFACNGCGKRFTCISNLQAHRKVHADTCGLLPLNAKASQYMGVQKGVLLVGTKPEAGLE